MPGAGMLCVVLKAGTLEVLDGARASRLVVVRLLMLIGDGISEQLNAAACLEKLQEGKVDAMPGFGEEAMAWTSLEWLPGWERSTGPRE